MSMPTDQEQMKTTQTHNANNPPTQSIATINGEKLQRSEHLGNYHGTNVDWVRNTEETLA